MKIAILSPFPPYRGNISQLNVRMYLELSNKNEVKAFSFTTLYPNFLFPGKTQFMSKEDALNSIKSERILNSINPISYKKTANAINKYNPDVLIIPYWLSLLAPAFGSVVKMLRKNIKIIALVHNAIPHEKKFFDKPFAKFFFKKCDGFIVLSDTVQKDILELKPDAKILVAEHPIYDQYTEKINKTDACKTLGISPLSKNILFFGLIREYKGLDILIEAMNHLDDSYQLIIAGECYGNKDKYEKLIDASSLKKNIYFFEEYIPDDKVSIFFSVADLLVLPYRSATQSGVIALAYQMEQPILATNVGSLGTILKKSGTGIVVDSVSPKSIAENIIRYFEEDKEKYIYNIKREKQRLSWSSFIDKLQLFIDDISASSKK